MLTDIFADRYVERPIWSGVAEPERILLTQAWRIVAEQLMPYWRDGKVHEFNKPRWENVHSKLSMELGRESLSPLTWNFYDVNKAWQYGNYTIDAVCKTWMLEPFKEGMSPDRYMKERMSFIELAFRDRMEAIAAINTNLPEVIKQATLADTMFTKHLGMRVPGSQVEAIKAGNANINATFLAHANELNERFHRAKLPLNYHNGFIQIENDAMTQEQVAKPFWELMGDAKWKNVEIDMMEAVDRREANDRDPSFYAAKALESAIKIVSDDKGFTRGTEKNVNHYIDNLASEKNGRFIELWESEAIRHIFANVRNALSHGPGGEPMPQLTQQQTDWTIEATMSWTKSLIRRL